MQCDNCGEEIKCGHVEFFGFNFCFKELTDDLGSACQKNFGIALWQAAQASKEAERNPEGAAAKTGEHSQGLVDGCASLPQTSGMRNLR